MDKGEKPPDRVPIKKSAFVETETSEGGSEMGHYDDHKINEINSFSEINWKDPFAEPEVGNKKLKSASSRSSSKTKKKKKNGKLAEANINENIYDGSKFNEFNPPRIVFVPSKNIMMKMMRVCAECKEPIELYYVF